MVTLFLCLLLPDRPVTLEGRLCVHWCDGVPAGYALADLHASGIRPPLVPLTDRAEQALADALEFDRAVRVRGRWLLVQYRWCVLIDSVNPKE